MASYIFPVQGDYTITSFFGLRNAPTLGASTNHKGIDISVPTGTDVYSAIPGRVTAAAYDGSRGYNVAVTGTDGIKTIYQHLSGFAVKLGQMVNAGQKIGSSGDSGVSTGPHLHFEIQKDGKAVDPLEYFGATPGGTGPASSIEDLAGPVLELLKKYWWAAAIGLVIIGITK